MNQNNEMYKGNGLNDNNNNNNDNNDNNDIYGLGSFGAPITLGAMQKDMYKSNNYKSIGSSTMVDTFGLADISAPLPLGLNSKQANFPPISFGVTGKTFPMDDILPMPMGFGDLPTNNDFNDDNFNEFKSEELIFIPSKCGNINNNKNKGISTTPLIFNEITSMVIDESPNNVLKVFDNILNNFSNDIDYNIDELNYIINGQIFIRNFQIFFKISIWNEMSNGTRFEVRRTKGDTIIFNQFWDEIKQLINKKFNNNNNNDNFGFNLPPIEYNLTFDDLNNFIIDINESDPCSVYSIAMVLNALKTQTKFTQIVFNHEKFIKCIIEKALTHQDAALVRGGLITLDKLCSEISIAPDTLINSYNILEYVIPVLSFDCQLIQKYCIRLLYRLSNAKLWTFNNKKLQKFAQINIKQFQQKWKNSKFANNDFIKKQMFENINSKLVAVN